MYKQVDTAKQVAIINGGIVSPVASLEDEYGGKAHFTVDDSCYVLVLKDHKLNSSDELQKEDKDYFKNSPWIFHEAFEVLKTLPSLRQG